MSKPTTVRTLATLRDLSRRGVPSMAAALYESSMNIEVDPYEMDNNTLAIMGMSREDWIAKLALSGRLKRGNHEGQSRETYMSTDAPHGRFKGYHMKGMPKPIPPRDHIIPSKEGMMVLHSEDEWKAMADTPQKVVAGFQYASLKRSDSAQKRIDDETERWEQEAVQKKRSATGSPKGAGCGDPEESKAAAEDVKKEGQTEPKENVQNQEEPENRGEDSNQPAALAPVEEAQAAHNLAEMEGRTAKMEARTARLKVQMQQDQIMLVNYRREM